MLPLCCLNLPGPVIKKLLDAGFMFAEDVFLSDNEFHPEVKKLFNSNAGLKKTLLNYAKEPRKISAAQLIEAEEKTPKIFTFCYKLDKILGGGIPLGVITEVCGAPGSGKTQLCLQLCVSVQLQACLEGMQAEAIYIDTDAGFSPQRIKEIARGCREHCCRVASAHDFTSDVKQQLEKQSYNEYFYVTARDYTQLLTIVSDLESFIELNKKVKLVVIDSLDFCFLQQTDMLKRTSHLCKTLLQLKRLASHHNLAVVITNHLTTRISRGEDQLVPALGESVGYLMDQRVILGSLPLEARFGAVIFKSPVLPNSSAEFTVTTSGIRDIL